MTKVEVSINLGPLTSKADIEATRTDVCFVPIADIDPRVRRTELP